MPVLWLALLAPLVLLFLMLAMERVESDLEEREPQVQPAE